MKPIGLIHEISKMLIESRRAQIRSVMIFYGLLLLGALFWGIVIAACFIWHYVATVHAK